MPTERSPRCIVPGCDRPCTHCIRDRFRCPMHARIAGHSGPRRRIINEPKLVPTASRLRHLLAVLTTMPTECTAWRPVQSDGYGYVNDSGRQIGVHALVCEWYHGPRPPGMQVRHLCGHRACFTPSHLCWGTAAENAIDRIRHAREGHRLPSS